MINKIVIVFSLILFVLISPVNSEPVTIDNVLMLGAVYLDEAVSERKDKSSDGKKLSEDIFINNVTLLKSNNDQILAYVVELEPTGYIVISSDTEINPIIAYSFESNFPFSDPYHPLYNLVSWDMTQRLNALPILEQNLKESNRELWEGFLASDKKIVKAYKSTTSFGPWIKTNWDQNDPYNKYLPCFDSFFGLCTQRAVVGCAATAMSQVINYWEYPSTVQFDQTDNYTTTTEGIDIDGDADAMDFLSFDELNDLLLNIDYNEEDNIAALNFAVGISLEMDYQENETWWWFDSSSSGAHMTSGAFQDKFAYLNADIRYSSDEDFYDTLERNMKEALPALLAIYEITEGETEKGHAIVIDGVKSSGEYHLNFGWGGSSNGWYFLPKGLPADYNTVSYAIANIYPYTKSLDVTHTVSLSSSSEVQQGGLLGPINVSHINNSDIAVDFTLETYITLPDDSTIYRPQNISHSLSGRSSNIFSFYIHIPPLAETGVTSFGILIDYENDYIGHAINDDDDKIQFNVIAASVSSEKITYVKNTDAYERIGSYEIFRIDNN